MLVAVAGEGCETLAAAEPSDEVVLVEESVGVGNCGGVSESGGAVGGVGGRPRVDLEQIESIATRFCIQAHELLGGPLLAQPSSFSFLPHS